jgi:hypothetical protein
MPFTLTPNVHVERTTAGGLRHLRHLQQPYRAGASTGRPLAAHYLNDVAHLYRFPASAVAALGTAFRHSNDFTREPVQLHLASEAGLKGVNTFSYVQTVGGLPIWEAGVSVTLQSAPDRVTSSVSTFHHDIELEPPERDFRPYDAAELRKLLGLEKREQKAETVIEITAQRRLIYRYQASLRTDPENHVRQATLQAHKPVLPIAPIDERIKEGRHYVVTEVLFTTNPGRRAINWRVFIEERTQSVLYLRALLACVSGGIFKIDPISDTGTAGLTGCSGDATLDALQTTVTLPLVVSSPQTLTSEFVTLADFRLPASAPPVSPPTTFTGLASDSVAFAAVNAFYHIDRFFRLMKDDLGIDPATYFSATTLPLQVDHLDTTEGDPQAWTYQNPGFAGCLGIGFAHTSSTFECANPVGMGADQRVAFHECSHMILLEKIHALNFGFCHSTGDSLAVIFADPRSSAPDRFSTFPFVPDIPRRHDRDVTAGWAFGGIQDDHGYGTEEILSTTQFRLYRSAGGDDDRNAVQLYGSNYTLYLIISAVASLGPGTIVPTPSADIWATALMNADAATTTFDGIPGGTVHKMVRWTFEKQGVYQPPGAPTPVASAGAPPDVDVYIDDGRGGEYPYLEAFWNNLDIWNRNMPDGGTGHDTPVTTVPNYAYVRVKNRGTQTANNVTVQGFHADPSSGLNWPDDWMAMTTASLSAGSIPAGGSAVVGPFTWTPQFVGHECMLMIASADGDLANTDTATLLPCATGPTPHWRLVPFDNNIGQRNVAPVAGGASSGGLTASFANRRFTARNPFDRTARLTLEAVLPDFLARRGWSARFLNAGGERFTLGPRGSRQIVFTLVPGADFAPHDVPKAAKDAPIQIHTRIDGLLIGGMSYHVDPTLKLPPDELPPRGGHGGPDHGGGPETLYRHVRHRHGHTRIVIEIDGED